MVQYDYYKIRLLPIAGIMLSIIKNLFNLMTIFCIFIKISPTGHNKCMKENLLHKSHYAQRYTVLQSAALFYKI
jgi:hypothetical protein